MKSKMTVSPEKLEAQELNDEVAQELDDEIDPLDPGYLVCKRTLLHKFK